MPIAWHLHDDRERSQKYLRLDRRRRVRYPAILHVSHKFDHVLYGFCVDYIYLTDSGRRSTPPSKWVAINSHFLAFADRMLCLFAR